MVRRLPPALLSLVFLLELPFLAQRPLARDEVTSVEAAHKTYGALWGALHGTDAAVGLYYALLHPVVALSDTTYAVREPSLLFIILATATLLTTATRLWGRRAASLIGLMLIANPVMWEFSTIVRPYALALFVAAVTLHLVLVVQKRPVVLGLVAVFLLYLQGMFGLLLVMELALLIRRKQWSLVVALGAAIVAWLPLAYVMTTQTSETSWEPLTGITSVAEQVHEVFGSDGLLSAAALLVWGAVLVLAARQRDLRPLLVMTAVPAFVLLVLGLHLHLLGVRYILWIVLVLAAAGGVALSRLTNVLPFVVALSLLGLASIATEATIPYRLENLPQAAAWMGSQGQPGDALLFSPDWARTPFLRSMERAHGTMPTDVALKPVANRFDVGHLYLPEKSRAQVLAALRGRNRVWVVGYDQDYYPVANTSGDIAKGMEKTWKTAAFKTFGQVQIRLLVRPS